MKIFGALLLLMVLVGGFGFYRGWFSMSTQSGDVENSKVNVNLTVDPNKMEADADAVKDKVHELTGEAKAKTEELDQQSTETLNTE
ncbi:hypothetical protein SH528x_002001 [Novipirellula sp. SH528]|uniref:hypothetical protein n=1 Tax=Novipirellula sp. SH528 TaxID=3454466 RepID=UPI003FA17649